MSLELRKKIAQMLCMGFQGFELSSAPNLQSWLGAPEGIGSLILFDYDYTSKSYAKNIRSLPQLKKLNQDIKLFYREKHPDLPIWLSIDVEGGRVDRLSKLAGYAPLPSALEMSALDETERKKRWLASAKLLKDLCFDINFAPVVDLNLSPNLGIFGPLKRCFSNDPIIVEKFAREYISILQSEQIMGCLKHFPGHGSALGDSHEEFVDVSDTFHTSELKPFESLTKDKNMVQCIMTAHVINRQLEPNGTPATLSKTILSGKLRHEMGYEGLIISDDLQMHAIAKHFSLNDALVKTINAGADMIIFGNQLGESSPNQVIDMIENLVNQGEIKAETIHTAFTRIKHFKQKNMPISL